jgi:hypothetical protein
MTAPVGLPPAAELVALARRHGPAALDAYTPAIDELTDTAGAAAWLGLSAASIYRDRNRLRPDRTPAWPPADRQFGRSPAWTYRTLVLHRLAMPGRGSAGRGRPARDRAAATPGPGPARRSARTSPAKAGTLPRLTARRLAALRHAAATATGGIPSGSGLTIRDVEALEQLGYAASIDDCGHVNANPSATARGPHRSHPHFLRITPAGRDAVQATVPAGG